MWLYITTVLLSALLSERSWLRSTIAKRITFCWTSIGFDGFCKQPVLTCACWSNDVIRARPLEKWQWEAISTRWLSVFLFPLGSTGRYVLHRHGLHLLSKHAIALSNLNSTHPWYMRQSSGRGEWKSKKVSVCQYGIKSYVAPQKKSCFL